MLPRPRAAVARIVVPGEVPVNSVRCSIWLAVAALTAPVAAQTFDYPNFASTAGLTLNGAAAQTGSALRVAGGSSGPAGSAWRTMPVMVTEGFETTFDFLTTPSPEGLAFVIHGASSGASALGGDNWGMGYGFGLTGTPIARSIAIEIDGVQQGFLSDTSGNEVSVHTLGALGNSENEGIALARISPAGDLSNNALHRMRIAYTPGLLDIYVDNLLTPLLSVPFTFENGGTMLAGGSTGGLGLPGSDAWVGFTSATTTGVAGQSAEVRSWSWISYRMPPPCYTGNVLAGAGGPYDLLRVNGSTGGFFRTARLNVADPFTLSLATPPGLASAPFVLCATIGVADTTTVTTTPYGSACFPLFLPLDIGSSSAPYSLPVPPGIVLTLPLTLQAVMATSAVDPAQIQLTNAIALQWSFAPAPTISGVTPNSAPVGGTITVNGNNFSPFATVDISGVPVTPNSITRTQVLLPMPTGLPCGAVLRVRNPDGAQATIPFNPTPTITSQVNSSGPAAGGTSFIMIGTGFAPNTTVTIGGVPATVSTAAATVIVCLTPPNTPGPKQVVVRTPGGCTVNSTFTYL